ncbi:MAG: phage holin family protein [Acidobacteria bacterium]|jgi:formate hydrogenlyase subunit 4|nr:phage holin family protein [Acidobacteriota bacterium]
MAQQQVTTTPAKDERSLGELFSDLASETSNLVKQEVSLAQTEMTQKAVKVGKNVGFLVVGGAVGYAALLSFIAALIIGLGNLLDNYWLAALIVGVVIAIAAVVLILSAISALKNTQLTPTQTVETIKEDAQWLKDQMN